MIRARSGKGRRSFRIRRGDTVKRVLEMIGSILQFSGRSHTDPWPIRPFCAFHSHCKISDRACFRRILDIVFWHVPSEAALSGL